MREVIPLIFLREHIFNSFFFFLLLPGCCLIYLLITFYLFQLSLSYLLNVEMEIG